MRKLTFYPIILILLFSFQLKAQDGLTKRFNKIVFGCKTESLDSFRDFAIRARESGATHIAVQAEDLPIAYWELDPADDPYPAWVITNPGLLKINPPEILKLYIPGEYGKSVMDMLRQRCKILREAELQASFHTFEPQMLPEDFFAEYPALRGPQVDNPMRARVDRFAPSVSHPQVLGLYDSSMKMLKEQCPEIDILEFRTSDSGAGLGWSDALYAGPNGNTKYRSQKMSDRIHGFLSVLQHGLDGSGDEKYLSDVHIYNTKESRKEDIAHQLESGQALDNVEGPVAKPYKYEVGSLLYYRKSFAPVPGIPVPLTFLTELEGAQQSNAERLFVLMEDYPNQDLYFTLFDAFRKNPTHSAEERFRLLNEVAEDEVGGEAAGYLVKAWSHLHEAEKFAEILSSGGSVFIVGCVHQRWLVRPFVPFPERLTMDEKAYYWNHLFQAREERNANDLLDIQGSRFVDGFNGFRLTNRMLSRVSSNINAARQNLSKMRTFLSESQQKKYDLLDVRLRVYRCLISNVRNSIHYQVVLDRAKALDQQEADPPYPFVAPSDYLSRQELLRVARSEMDNAIELMQLLEEYDPMLLIDHADSPEKEYHRLLGSDLIDQLEKKIHLMRKYWSNYKEIQTN